TKRTKLIETVFFFPPVFAACHTGEFRCLKSYFCIPERRVRDGWEDCPDGSDESESADRTVYLQTLIDVKQNANESTEEETAALLQPTGLMATLTRSEVHGEQTTIYTTDIRRQFVDGTYTQVLSTHSNVLELAPSLNEVEGAFHQRGRQRPQTTHGVESFGSLSSGKIFQTAVNELASTVTTRIHATKVHHGSLLRSISGDKSTTVLGLNIKNGHVGSLDQHQDSEVPVITVTGTEGLLVQGTGTEQMTYKVFTGTYVNNEGDDSKTYMFFFGNRQLPVEATPSLPEEQKKSEQFDIRSGNQKGVVLDISHKIGVILPSHTVTTIEPTEAPRSDSLIFGSGNAHDGELMTGMLIEGSEPITIEGMTRTRTATSSTMQVTLDLVPAQSQRDVVRVALTKKATPTLYRHGRKFQPTATGRKITPMDGSTIITDKFFLPQHLGLYTTSPISGASKTTDEFFEDADHDYNLLTPSPIKDIRPTKTVGSHHDDFADEVGDVFATDAAYVFNKDGQRHEHDVEKKKTRITLFGFVDFTTSISGTEVVFQPAATGVSYNFGNTKYPQAQDIYNPFNIPTQKKQEESVLSSKGKNNPYGTATREFVSKMSMLTSTFKGGVEMQSTMFTSTIPMLLKSRTPKYESYTPDEQDPLSKPEHLASKYLMASVTESLESSIEEHMPVLESETVMVSMIEGSKTEDFTSSPTETVRPTPKLKRKKTYKTGLVSLITGTVVHGDMTTEWTTLIIGTLIGGRYAHVIQSTSSIFYTQTKTDTPEEITTTKIPTPLPGLILPGDIQIEGLSDQPVTEPNIQPKTDPPAVTVPEPQPETNTPPVTEANIQPQTEPPPVTEETREESSENNQDSLDVYSITSNFAIPLINQSRVIEESYETALSGQDQPSVVALSDGLFLSTLVPTMQLSSTLPSSTQKVQLLTDGFILPGDNAADKYEPSSATSSSDGDGQRIITMGFILPGADPVKQFEDDLISSDDVKVLTDGFLLPGHDVLPSSEPLESKSTLQGRIAESATLPLEEITTVTSYPITHYSTFTYYTTLNQDGSNIVSSREVTTSKVFENSDQYEQASLFGRETASLESSMLPLDATSTAGITTLMTAYTYFSTFVSDGSMVVSSSEKTLSNLLTPTESYDADVTPISPSVATQPTTLFTTYTYYTTMTNDGSTVVSSREEVISNVATPGPKDSTVHKTKETPDLASVGAPTTYFTTYTYLTTLFKDGTSSITSNLETVSNVAHGSTKAPNQALYGMSGELIPTSTTPVTTFYTTYTYLTTLLKDGTSVVSSREEVVSNIMKGTVISFDASPSLQPRSKPDETEVKPTESLSLSTYLTTYTYYTTFVRGGTTTIRNRTQVVSKVKTMSAATETELITTPVVSTYYTTYTYFTTVNRGGTKSVKSRESVKTNVVTKYPKTDFFSSTPPVELITSYTTILSPVTVYRDGTPRVSFISRTSAILKTVGDTPATSVVITSVPSIAPTKSSKMQMMYTTYTYYTTLYDDGKPIVSSREETITNLISPTAGTPDDVETSRNEESSTIVRTYYTTYTYFTTFETEGTPTVTSREEVVTNYVTMTPHDIITGVSPTSSSQEHDAQYTTYTYFTTRLLEGRPVTSTRYETVTNYVTVTTHRPIAIYPTTVLDTIYTTYTYFTTSIVRGRPTVSTRYETLTNYVTVTVADRPFEHRVRPTDTYRPIIIQPTAVRDTVYTTYTYFTTRLLRGQPIVSTRYETVTDYVTVTVTERDRIRPTNVQRPIYPTRHGQEPYHTGYTTYTYYTTRYLSGRPVVNTRYETITNVATVTITENATPETAKVEPSFLATPSPQTFYTTFSYFTTVLSDGKPSISTRLETITNVFTNVILPTRAVTVRPQKETSVPSEAQSNFLRYSVEEDLAMIHRPQRPPSRKLLSFAHAENEHSLEDQFIVTDEELASAHRHKFGLVPRSAGSDPNPSPADKTKEYPTGLIQSVEARAIRNGATTVYATEVYGTFINGAYAQVVSTAVRVFSDSPNGLGQSAKSSTKDDILTKSVTPTSASQLSHATGLLSSFSNTVIHDRTTTAYTTNIYGTYIRGMYAHVAQTTSTVIKPQSTQPSSSITENQQYKTGLLSSLVNTEIHDATTTIWKTQVYGTLINGFYAHVASTVSEVVKPTRTTFVQASSTHSPVYVASSRSDSSGQASKSKSYTTGLLSARTNTIVNGGRSTEVVTNIYGTFVGDLYAQVARTTTRTVPNEIPLPSKTTSTAFSSTPAKLLGIISSTVQSVTNGNVVTYYTTELHGTNVGNLYAQIARTSTRTETIRVQSTKASTREFIQKTGLLSTNLLSSEVHGGTTTLHVSEVYGTYIGEAYAQFGRSTRRIIAPSTTSEKPQQPESQKTGLVSSTISTDVQNGVTTLYTTEIHGTYINGFYAHIARRSSQVLQSSTHQTTTAPAVAANSETHISSEINTEIRNGATTLHTTNVYGTYINGFYAHVARSTSRVLEQKISSTSTAEALKTGLVSRSVRTAVGNGLVTEYSTDVYGTFINGFYAHIARTTTNVSPQPTSKETDSTAISSTALFSPLQAAKSTSDTRIFTTPTFSTGGSTPTVLRIASSFTTTSAFTEQSTLPISSRIPPATAVPFETITESSFISSKPKINFVELDTTTENILDEIGLTTTLNVEKSLNDKSVVPSFEEITLFSSLSSETIKESIVIPTPIITIEIKEEKTQEPDTTFISSITVDSTQTNEIFEKDSSELREPSTVRFRPVFPTRRPHAPHRSTLAVSSDLQDEDGDDYGGNEFLDEEDEDYNEYDEKSVQPEEPKPRPTKRHRPTRAGYTRGPRQPQTTHQIKHQGEDDELDIYHEDDYEQGSRAKSQASRADDARPHSAAAGINIRPFRRDRGAFGVPSRTASKPSFTLQLRRPQVRQRINGRRPVKEAKHDDDDIEAEEAVHSSAATPQLHLGRRRGSARPLSGKVGGRPTPFTRTRPSNDKTHGISPNRGKAEDEYSDYDEEEEDYTTERVHPGRGRLNIKPTARLPSNGRTRGLGGRQPTRVGPTHQEDNDSNEETHSNGRLRGRLNPLAKNRRNRNRGRAPNLKSSFNAVGKDVEESPNLPFARLRGNRRRSSYNPRARRTSLTSKGHGSTKPAVTVTSVITTVKTLPIYHGFKTSYATLTTTAFASSVILPTAYSTVVDDDGNTKTFLSSKTDSNGLFRTVTEVLITTTDLQQFRILPIKVGFSTRTDTITETTVLTQLTTVFSTITPDVIPTTPATAPPAYPVPFYPQIPNQDFSLLTSSYVTTETIVTSTVLPIVLRGRTLLSTIKTTKFSESTITKTASVPVPQVPTAAPYIPQPYFAVPQITTLLTLYVTGDQGDVIPVVTTVTVPFYQQPFFHTKVARSVPDRASQFATLASTAFLGFPIDGSRLDALGRDERPDEVRLFSSGVESSVENSSPNSESTSTLDNADSKAASEADAVTTISMGPLTEVYEQPATENHKAPSSVEVGTDNKYGIGARFVSRKLQQFPEERDEEVRPVRDFTRLRGRVRATPVEALALPTPEALVDNSGSSSPDFEFSDGGHHNDALDGARHGVRRGRILRRPVQRNRAIIDGSSPSFNGFRGPHGGFIRRRPPHVVPDHVDLNPPQEHNGGLHLGEEPQAFSPGNLHETSVAYLSSYNLDPSPSVSLDNLISSSFVGDGHSLSSVPVGETSLSEPQSSAVPARGSRRTVFRRVRPTNSKHIGERRTSLVRKTRPITSTPVFQLTSVSVEPTHDTKRLPSADEVTPNPHQFKRIIRVKKPGEAKNGQRRKVVLNRRPSVNSLQARGPVTNGNEDLVAESSNPTLSFEIGATVPLTYYTTFTYLTTFLHGTDTVYNSREAVLSSIVTETLNSNIVNVIQNHGGFTTALDGISMVHLGSRTKGAATTIVNLESRLQIFNSDIFRGIHATPTEEPLQSPYQKAPEFNSGTVQLTDLARLPKTIYTLYTYYYTLFDGLETKSSVRSEISSSIIPGENEFLPPIKHTRIRNGLLPLGLDVTTVHLGSRDIDGTTTEVNIGMRTVIKFDGVKDAVIGEFNEPIVPTASVFPSHATEAVDNKIEFISNQERSSLLEDALQPSYSIAHDDPQHTTSVHATPVILFPVDETTDAPRAKVRIISSRVNKPIGGLKSGVFQAAPGVRVRIKPVIRQPEEDPVTIPPEKTTHDYDIDTTEGLTSPSPIVDVTEEEHLLSSVFEAPTTPEDEEHHKGRKRLKVTLRRPTPGDKLARTNSVNTRFVRPSRFEITTKPRFYVVTRTNAAGVARPTKNPFTVKVSKRVKSTDLIRATPSVSIIYETFTTTTSVPVIFGLQTSYREVVITASTPLTVTITPTFGGRSPDLIEPSETVMLTYFTTTTYTVPYTLGDQTLFTTVRETNSRIVTETVGKLNSHQTDIVIFMLQFDTTDFIFFLITIVAASHVLEDIPASRYPDDYLDYSAQLIGRAAPKHQSSLELFASHYQHRPGLSTRISDGVTLIVASGGDFVASTQLFSHQATPYTLQPTLLLDAVLMKEHFDGQNVSPQPYSVSYSTKTLFTTYTYFTTFFTDDSSSISSSEQVISNTVTIPVTQNIQPTATPHPPELKQAQTYLETSERVVTSTSYNTFTFYATLFNGSSSVVTPFEEVQSQVFTITESFTITRTIMPSSVHLHYQQQQHLHQLQNHQLQPSVTTLLSTLYSTQTNFITFFQGTSTIVTSIEEILSDIVTLTVPHGLATPVISHSYLLSPTVTVPEFSTRTYLTTQTQYVTFFRGKETILSSIEEIGTTVVTERVGSRPSVYSRPYGTPIASSIAPTRTSTPTFVLPSYSATPADLVPSIRTYYTTYTYFTTFFTDSSSIVASRENVVTSHVTLFVPRASLTIAPTTTRSSTPTYYRPTLTTPPYDTKLYTTGTTYTTYTFYTTLFGGQDKIVISSEQVVPQIVTTRIGSKPSTTSTRAKVTPTVLTHFTTYTYFTTLVKESETIVSSSEEVITQLVSTTITPSSTTSFVPEVNIVTSSLHKPPKKETAVKVTSKVQPSSSKKPERVSTFKPVSSQLAPKSSTSSFTSVTLFGSTELKSSYSIPTASLRPSSSTPSFTTLHSGFIEEESTKPLLGVSTTVIDGSTVIFFTDIPGGQDDDDEVDAFSSSSLFSLNTVSEVLSPVFVPPDSATESSTVKSTFDTLLLSSSPVTSTTVLDSSTRYIGHDNETTTLSPNVTLFVVTGTDGILTRLTEATFTSRTSDVSPSKAAAPVSADIIPTEIPTVQQAPLPTLGDGGAGGGLGIGFPSKPIKPGSIIDLADVLGGNANLGGNIGEAIKGIVHLLSNGKRNETDNSGDLHPSQVKDDSPLPPTDGVTVSNIEEPVYIPVGAIASDSSGRKKATRVESTQARHPETDGVNSESLFTFMHSSEYPVYSDDVHTDIITGVETIFLGPTESHYDDDAPDAEDSMPERADKDATVHLVGSVQKSQSSSSSSDSPTPALDSSTEVITGDKTIFFGDFDKFSELTQRAEDHKGDITISDPKEFSKFVGVQTIFFPDAPLQSSIPSELQITGATTIFGDSFTPILPDLESKSSFDSPNSSAFAPGGAKSVSGATTIFFQLDGDRAPILPPVSTSVSTVTQYVTSVESVTRTLTLTTTKVYYTRDSPLTITSVFTTTIAPRTFVSTIIGSRTILGTLPEATETVEGRMTTPLPTEATTTVTTTTLIFNSITTTVVRTLVIPTERPEPTRSSSFDYPATTSFKIPFPKPPTTTTTTKKPTRAPPVKAKPGRVTPVDGYPPVCLPGCNVKNKEVCRELQDGTWACHCKPGYGKQEGNNTCTGK
ncbi:unnamed protein product, partial [Ixodes persulcatus]